MRPVFVFKTSVASRAQVKNLKPMLDRLMQPGDRWNFDLEDCDHILRVESAACNTGHVVEALEVAGHDCVELL